MPTVKSKQVWVCDTCGREWGSDSDIFKCIVCGDEDVCKACAMSLNSCSVTAFEKDTRFMSLVDERHLKMRTHEQSLLSALDRRIGVGNSKLKYYRNQ